MSDADRARIRAAWEDAAAGWDRWQNVNRAAGAPVSAWMIDAIAPQPGHVVLEVAAGPGDTGFLAAELIHPGGRLICTDGAEAMVEAARKRAAELGIANAEFVAMEAEWLDMAAASVDAVLCRYGYMLVPDPEAALREARRVLRPGGRVALAVWDSPEVNPELTAGRIALKEIGKWEEPPADAPGPFALADPSRLRALLEDTGFTEITVDAVDISVEPGTLDDAFAMLSALSPALRAGLKDLSPAEHTHLRDAFDAVLAQYVAEDGSVVIPGRTLVAAASA
jgi:ubiquinone/menaquinone biosynthesis C-methylase UbiE